MSTPAIIVALLCSIGGAQSDPLERLAQHVSEAKRRQLEKPHRGINFTLEQLRLFEAPLCLHLHWGFDLSEGELASDVLEDKYVLQEADGSQSSHPATRRYHYAKEPLAVTTGTVTSYLNVDALGSVTDATSSTGTVTTARQYDAWGQYRNNTAPTPSEPKLGFTGHQFDVETGLVYARARYYDPELGIFLSRDSVEGHLNDAPSLHRYSYVHNNPLRYTDPDGHAINVALGLIGAGVGFAVGFGAALLDDAPLSDALIAGGIGAGIGGVAGLTLGASLAVEGATTLGVVTLTATKVAVGSSLDVARQKLAIDSGRQQKFSYRELAAAVGASVAVPVGKEVAQVPNIALVAKSAGVVLGTAGVAVTGPEAVTAALNGEGQQAMSAGFDTFLSGLGVAAGWSLGQPAPSRSISLGRGDIEPANSAAELSLNKQVLNPHFEPFPNARLSDLPLHERYDRFFVRASEFAQPENLRLAHPLNSEQMFGSPQVGHGGVRNLSNADLLRFGGPAGNDPISGTRLHLPGDDVYLPGRGIGIAGGHHRSNEIGRRVGLGLIDPNELLEMGVVK